MHTFSRIENVESLCNEAEVLEAAIASELNAQDVDCAATATEIQVDIDASEMEIARHCKIITAKHAERENSALREGGRERLEELPRTLADSKHELAVINSPILILPYEIMAEIFNWHLLMGGSMATPLLICKRWTTVAYTSPRLWSRIAVTNCPPDQTRLQGAIRCNDLDKLRSVLSRARSSPLQLELYWFTFPTFPDHPVPSTTLHWGPLASSNWVTALALILDNRVLKRCTYFVLGAYEFAIPAALIDNLSVLPLLSSLDIDKTAWSDHGIQLIQSLVKVSPSLQHIRCHRSSTSPQDLGVGAWMKAIESYGWIDLSKPCPLLYESPSLREIGVFGEPVVPLTLPTCQILRWAMPAFPVLHLITAPHLHTLILLHYSRPEVTYPPGSITFPNLRVAVHAGIDDLTALHVFHTPALEHLSIQFATASLTALLELFDGSTYMPTPKSLHLECEFTDGILITTLARLPWLEELQIAGTIAQDAFWEGSTPSSSTSWRVWIPASYPDERAHRILAPNLKILLVNYSTGKLYVPPEPNPLTGRMEARRRHVESRQTAELPHEKPQGRKWTVEHASAVAIARERAGFPLETLACWFPEQKVEVLIGDLDRLPQRPVCVLLAALWCPWNVLTYC